MTTDRPGDVAPDQVDPAASPGRPAAEHLRPSAERVVPAAEDREPLPSSGMRLARQRLAAARAAARRQGHRPGQNVQPAAPGQEAGRAPAARQSQRRAHWQPQRRQAGQASSSYSAAGPDERDPTPLGQSLDRLREERGWQVELAVGAVVGRWSTIVGPELAAHAQPESFAEGELVLTADSTAWATQLRLLTPALLRRLEEELGPGVVTGVRVRGPVAPSWRRGRRTVPGRGPRDTYG